MRTRVLSTVCQREEVGNPGRHHAKFHVSPSSVPLDEFGSGPSGLSRVRRVCLFTLEVPVGISPLTTLRFERRPLLPCLAMCGTHSVSASGSLATVLTQLTIAAERVPGSRRGLVCQRLQGTLSTHHHRGGVSVRWLYALETMRGVATNWAKDNSRNLDPLLVE